MLSADDFTAFFTELHGYTPFHWQARLAQQVATTGTWPDSISVPTGYGKTSVIEIAAFALAVNPALPRRTVLVVDRRLVVDHAYDTAVRLAAALRSPLTHGPTVQRVAQTLSDLGGESPLATAILRGGMYRKSTWVRNPAQPMIICSTVDQVGSRLLHRGYGVSERMLSVHAGFLAHDTVCILDEAHIAEPFRQTVSAIQDFAGIADRSLPRPITLVTMSATLTPDTDSGAGFSLTTADADDPGLARRRHARKTVTLIKASDGNMADRIAREALRLGGTGRTILVVVNRVRRARAVALCITERDSLAHILVITGRSRPIERDELMRTHAHRIFSGRDRRRVSGDPPLYVISTQAIEVGSDIDADGLVTEACPLIPLQHRTARVDRVGALGESRIIVVGDTMLNKEKTRIDPVYGKSLKTTWKYLKQLNERGPIDLGNIGWETINATLDAETRSSLGPDQGYAPIMTPAYCDLWVQTSPRPRYTPDPALFLHGPNYRTDEVEIIWRADLDPHDPESWARTIELFPPVAGEALSLPIYPARQLLCGTEDDPHQEVTDLLATPNTAGSDGSSDDIRSTPALVWRGSEHAFVITEPCLIHVGDTIVLPCAAGGCDSWGWVPPELQGSAELHTADIADQALAKTNRPVVIRVHPSLPETWNALPGLHTDQQEPTIATIDVLLARALKAAQATTAAVNSAVARLLADRNRQIHPHPSGTGWVVRGTRWANDADNPTSSGGRSPSREPVALTSHHDRVATVVRSFSDRLGLSEALRENLACAAALHDIGKADPREQMVYCSGNRIRAACGPLRAKSVGPVPPPSSLRALRKAAGVPDGFRHEILSAHLIEQSGVLTDESGDRDLILHLVATHHGRCRPYPPEITDPQPVLITAPFGTTEIRGTSDLMLGGFPFHHLERDGDGRFWRLIRRYGWWGLSYLEAIFRLADHRASEAEARGETA